MKVMMSVALSPEILRAVDEFASFPAEAEAEVQSPEFRRSRIIEQAVLEFLGRRQERRRRKDRNARDLAILNQRADDLNREVADVLAFQAEW